MKIGEENLRGFEAIARGYKKRSFAGERREPVIGASSSFKGAQAGGANCENVTAVPPHPIEAFGSVCRNRCPFRVHAVLRGILCCHGQKGSGAHVQRHVFARYAVLLQLRKQLRREVETCSRRRN